MEKITVSGAERAIKTARAMRRNYNAKYAEYFVNTADGRIMVCTHLESSERTIFADSDIKGVAWAAFFKQYPCRISRDAVTPDLLTDAAQFTIGLYSRGAK